MIWWKHNKISTRRFISTLRILDRNSVFERDQTLLIFPKFDWEGRGNSCSDLLYFDTALDLDGWFEFKLYVLNCMKISFIIIMTIIMIMVMIIIIIIIIMIIIIIIFIFIIQFYFIFIYHMYTIHYTPEHTTFSTNFIILWLFKKWYKFKNNEKKFIKILITLKKSNFVTIITINTFYFLLWSWWKNSQIIRYTCHCIFCIKSSFIINCISF